MSFQFGQTILRRDVHFDGRINSVMTARVVADDSGGLLTWTAAGSQVMRRTTLTGDLIRKFTVEEVAAAPTMLAPRPWIDTSVLILTTPGASHSIWWFFDADNTFFGWYVNLETPSLRWSGGLDMHDLALDIWVKPDRSWVWKDEDEFAERTGHAEFWSDEEAAAVRAEGERVIALIEAGARPFAGSLTDFKPDPAWEPTLMPPTWDLPASDDLPPILGT